jgi:hypothetical protein
VVRPELPRPAPPRPEPPDKNNPLGEPTPQRRLWAAYLARGFNRASFARALGAAYSSLDNWDTGITAMSLETFARAARLVHYSLDELVHGVPAGPSVPAGHLLGALPPPAAPAGEVELPMERRRALLTELGASGDERATFGAVHDVEPAAYYLRTDPYIRAWFGAYRHMRPLTEDPMQAARHACEQAARATQSDGAKLPAVHVRSADLPPSQPSQPSPRLPRGKSA